MAETKNDYRVVYVEPNAESTLNTAYDCGDYKVKKFADPEDFCIVVDLEVEVKGRTFYYTKNGNSSNTVRYHSTENANGQRVRFMEGTKIYTNKEKTEYITSLTTNYTDCSLHDVQNGGTCEMFGIKSIDISYNNFMVPEVTIQFVDVRGVSLFAQEEWRHNLVEGSTGMEGIVNNDIQGSFFKCFFTFPYPKFVLKVKGFYGQMVSYELTCSDFRAAFESTTGNFNVTAKFIGYAFSFLNDVMANAVLAAPYSKYIGSDYWDENNGKRFTVTDKNGSKVPMMKLADMCKQFKSIKETVEEELSSTNRNESLREAGASEADIEVVNQNDLSVPSGIYMQRIAEFSAGKFTSTSDGEMCISSPSTHSYCVIVDSSADYDRYDAIMNDFTSANEEFKKYEESCPKLKEWYANNNNFQIVRYKDYMDICANSDEIEISSTVVTDDKLRTAIQEKAKDNHSKWTDWDNSHVYLYIDKGLFDILGDPNKTQTNDPEKAKKIVDDAAQAIMNKKVEDAFNFPPTLENITKIIMAHFETYAWMIAKCAKQIIDSGTARSFEKLGLNEEVVSDVVTEGLTKSSFVPPFPAVTETRTDEDGNQRTETTWIGKYDNAGLFEEIKLVDGILNGLEKEAQAVAEVVDDSNETNLNAHSAVRNPLSFLDLTVESGNVFGKANMSDTNSIFAHASVRAFTIMSTNTFSYNAMDVGKLDGENFVDLFGKDPQIDVLKKCLAGGITGDSLLKFVTENTTTNMPNQSAKSRPWYLGERLFADCTSKSGYLKLNIGTIEPNQNGVVLPIKDWSFAQIKEVSSGSSHKLKNSGLDNFWYTPVADEKYDSHSVFIKAKPCKYFSNTVNSLNMSSYSHGTIDGLFSSVNQTPSDIAEKYSIAVCDNNGNPRGAIGLSKYDDTGALTNGGEFALNVSNCFTVEEYYSITDNIEKSYYFLKKISTTETTAVNGITSIKSIVEDLPLYTQKARYMPMITLLHTGAYLWKYGNDNLRPSIKNKLINIFLSWSSGENWNYGKSFKDIQNLYEIKFKSGKTFKTLHESLRNSSMTIESAFLENCTNVSGLHDVYKFPSAVGPHGFTLIASTCDITSKVNESLLQIVSLFSLTSFNNASHESLTKRGPYVKKSDLLSYLNGFVEALKDKLNVSTEEQNPEHASTDITVDSANDVDDLRFGVYSYLKLLYDKWIASDLDITNYKFETMFGTDHPTFHFIDSFYNNIGKTYYINLATLVDMLVASQTSNGYSLLSMISNLYASNKMQFLCLQNFANLAQGNMMEQMFKPVPYIEMADPSNHPDFVVLYPGEASSKLEIKDGEYKDDTFYLNEEATWPIMISGKKAGSYPIPAFGVSYGQQYQSYFKNIQVDMNTPMVTEQSIKAKFMIAGGGEGDDNNGSKHVTLGQDLYTIYSNNSYTCTVTMMGCAWVQPMMYFVLLNVPMFRGSYMIVKVNHQIQAGTMTTTFTGVRMARTSTRAVRNYLIGQNNDSDSGERLNGDSAAHTQANLGNDCEYAQYSPLNAGGIIDGKAIIGVASVMQKDNNHVNRNSSARFNNPTGMRNKKYYAEDNKLYYIKYSNFTEGFKATAKRLLDFMAGTTNYCPKNPRMMDLCSGWILGKKWGDLSADEKTAKTAEAKKRAESAGLAHDVKLPITLDVLTRTTLSFGLHETGYHVRSEGEAGAKQAWDEYLAAGGTEDKITGQTATSASTIDTLVSGFTNAVQSSLNATDTYKSAKLSTEVGKKGSDWALIQIKGIGTNVLNAAFDCISTTYTDYFEYVYWSVGNGNVNNDATGVVVKLKSTKPSSHRLGVCKNFTVSDSAPSPIQITKEEDVNKSLKLALIKHCKKESITDVAKAKACFGKTFGNMDDKTLEKILELGSSGSSSVQSCSSLLGGDTVDGGTPSSKLNGGGFDGSVTNEKMKKVLANVGSIKSESFGTQAKKRGHAYNKVADGAYKGEWILQYNEYNGCCTSGPTTWYGRAGVSLGWWGEGRPVTFKNSHHRLEACGLVPVWHGTFAELDAMTSSTLRPGDVATLYQGNSGRKSQHGMMWTGKDWRSDCIQRHADCEGKTDQGSYAAVLWRHPDFQEPGKDVKHFI